MTARKERVVSIVPGATAGPRSSDVELGYLALLRFTLGATDRKNNVLQTRQSKSWELLDRYEWVRRWPVLTAVVAVLLAALFLVPVSSLDSVPATGPKLASSSPSGVPSPFYPYLSNPSSYPTPDGLPNVSGILSLPELSNITIGSSYVYVLLFVDDLPVQGNVLDFDTGYYSPAAAQSIALTGCTNSCTQHIPIIWNLPTPIAGYGGSPIQADALYVFGSGPSATVFAGASSNNTTMIYDSLAAGEPGSWDAFNGEAPFEGGNVHLAVAPQLCDVEVTTQISGSTLVTNFQHCFVPVQSGPNQGKHPTVFREGSGNAEFSSSVQPDTGSPPVVTGVIPNAALPGQNLTIYGSGFTGVRSVTIGSVATAYNVVSSTEISAVMPLASGSGDVRVQTGSGWSSAGCSGNVVGGMSIPYGSPEIYSITRNATTAGQTVTIYGIGLPTSIYTPVIVEFGSTRVPSSEVTVVNSTTLKVEVPTGTGTANVTVFVGTASLANAATCGAVFYYAPMYLFSLSPTSGEYPLTVILTGENFSSTAKVYFATKEAKSVTWISSTELEVQPSWVYATYETVSVTVQQGGYTSDSVNFHYTRDVVSVSAIVPNHAPVHGQLIVYGTGFNSTEYVEFGTKNGTNQQYVSPTEVIADAPTGITRVVNVTVHQSPSTSLPTCGALFTEGTAYPSGTPEITSFSSTEGVGGANITIYGLNLSSTDTALFDGVPAVAINAGLSNSTALSVQVPLGMGNVSVTVSGTSGTSPTSCTSEFDIVGAGSLRDSLATLESQSTLPGSVAAVPAILPLPRAAPFWRYPFGGVGTALTGAFVFATVGNEIEVYEGSGLVNISAKISISLGSATLDQIGDTALSIPGGTPGQLSGANDGAGEFLLATTDQQGRTVVESLVLQNIGFNAKNGTETFNWSEPNFVPPVAGSAEDPEVVAAPYGDYYATWLENGAGPEQLDEAVFSPSGTVIQAPAAVPGSGGGSASGHAATSSTIMVDPDGRPLIAWSWTFGNESGSISYTGAYSAPESALTLLESAWSNMTSPDFMKFGGAGLSEFESQVQTAMTNTSTDLTAGKLCGAQYNATIRVYTLVTWNDSAPLVLGPIASTCDLTIGSAHDTIVTPTGGALSPNFYLAAETAWLLESLGVGPMPDPNWGWVTPAIGTSGPFVPDTGAKSTDARGDSVQIASVTQTESVLWLDTIGSFRANSSTVELTHGTSVCGTNVTTDDPLTYQIVATEYTPLFGTSSGTFVSSSGLPSPYFTHLHGAEDGTWWANVTVTFQTKSVIVNNGCGSGSPNNGTTIIATPPTGWPTVETYRLTGSFTTGLDPSPFPIEIVSTKNANGNLENSLNWQNTVNSTAALWLNGTCSGGGNCANVSWSNGNYLSNDSASVGLGNIPGPLKGFGVNITAAEALVPNGTAPQVNTGEINGGGVTTESYRYSCTFGTIPTFRVWDKQGGNATNVTSSSATLFWNSTLSPANTTGWVSLSELNGETLNFSAQVVPHPNGTSRYFAEAVGLQSWGIYTVTFVVAASSGCRSGSLTVAELESYTTLGGNPLQVLGKPAMFEQDAPYDSITEQGGGATIAWQVPLAFEVQPKTVFVNGSLTVKDLSNGSVSPFVVPISPPLTPFTNYSLFGTNVRNNSATTYALNLTDLVGDSQYNVTLVLNYTTASNPHFTATNSLDFWYEKDTSGDGLTDWEKEYGWYVWYTNLAQDPIVEHVTANVNSYATNGLVSDYVEKEYGLNPDVVDTAGSHMLDTWNLTFSLGNNPLPNGSNFEVWNESSSFQPFSGLPGGNPVASGLQNISPTSAHGITSGDGSPYAAEVLWSYSALESFVGQPGVVSSDWLRAVIGIYAGSYTLTVWGKLSWGANPLATSTLENGLADGTQADPVNPEVLQFTMTSWGTTIAGASGDAAGLYLKVTNESDGQGTKFYGGYGPVDSNQSSPSWSGTYTASVPVHLAGRYAYFNISLNANESGTLKLLGSSNQSVDLVAGTSGSINNTWSKGSIVGWYKVLRIAEAANTILWTPANNTTLSKAPWGLKRYTGEPDFDLLVLNVSQATSVTGLPWATTTGNYGLSLSQGLNNILVPRTAFLTSPLAQALLNNTNTTFRVSSGAAENFNGTNWSSRSQTSGSNPVPTSSSPNPNFIWVISSLNQFDGASNGTGPVDFGGLPQNPLESGYQSRQVQSVIWINVSGYGSLKTDAEELGSLFAGLTLNSTGGVIGNLLPITNQLPNLGLSEPVLTALANTSLANSGAFSPPQFNQHWNPPPSNGWGSVGADIFNAVSGVVSLASTFASVVWNGLTAAAAYVATAASWLLQHTGLADLANQLAKALKALVSAMEWALNQLLQYIIKLASAAMDTAFQPIVAAAVQYTSQLSDDFQAVINDTVADRSAAKDEARFWSDVAQPLFYVALAVVVVIAIVLTILEDFSLGAGFIISIVVGVLVSESSISSLINGGGPNIARDFASMGPLSPAVANEIGNLTGLGPGKPLTPRTNLGPPIRAGGLSPETIETLGDLMGAGTTSAAGAIVLEAWTNHLSAPWSDMVGAALGVIGAVTCAAAYSVSSEYGYILSSLFDVDSLMIDFFGPPDGMPWWFNTLVILGDFGTLAADAHGVDPSLP
jgi:hypothetical protein